MGYDVPDPFAIDPDTLTVGEFAAISVFCRFIQANGATWRVPLPELAETLWRRMGPLCFDLTRSRRVLSYVGKPIVTGCGQRRESFDPSFDGFFPDRPVFHGRQPED